ncbi:MAG: hypothetical protein KBF85_02795 [Tabrizicola sp.]|nr:hypothetical protein [Tabrizicola sp.]
MPRTPGFKSDTQRERFFDGAEPYVWGGPLARTCGAKLRTGGLCAQPALAGEARCLRHGGRDAAQRFRERQRAGLKQGSVSAEEWARAEAKRARNALTWAWRKDPRLPGRTIDLGPDEAAFVTSAADLGVDVDGLYPALADWLRWRWRRHQKDRPNDGLWIRAARTELPRQRAAADTALVWVSLGITDRRTREARAARKALRAGGVDGARAVVDALRAASSAAVDVPLGGEGEKPAGPLTALPVRPWTAGLAADGWKRRQADRQKPPPAPPRPPKPLGRPPRVPDSPEDLAAYGAVLRAAGPQVRAMYEAIPRQEDRLRFLRDLAGYANAPDDAGALRRWMVWVSAINAG